MRRPNDLPPPKEPNVLPPPEGAPDDLEGWLNVLGVLSICLPNMLFLLKLPVFPIRFVADLPAVARLLEGELIVLWPLTALTER